MLADLRSILVNGVQVLSSPDDRICSALGCNTILNVEVIPLRAKFGESLAQGFVQGNFRCVRNRSASTKLWGETLTDTAPERQHEAPAGGPQSLQGGMAREILKRCSTVSRGEEVQPFFLFRCPQSPPKQRSSCPWCSRKTHQPRANL